MSKSRHQRHIRTLNTLWSKGWEVVAAWNYNKSLGCSCRMVGKFPFYHSFNMFNVKGNGYLTPPFAQMPYTIFVVKHGYRNDVREIVLHGWKELRDFVANTKRWIGV